MENFESIRAAGPGWGQEEPGEAQRNDKELSGGWGFRLGSRKTRLT